MIASGENGKVIVRDGEISFDLSKAEEYTALVLRLTNPDERVEFDAELFAVDESLTDEARAKANRYATFLSDFVRKRSEILKANKLLTAEQREAAIGAFIEQLKADV